jgi:tetratricopeptide (TPR) repeat protein
VDLVVLLRERAVTLDAAVRAWAAGDHAAAEAGFLAAIAASPGDAGAWTGLGLTWWRVRRYADALVAFQEALAREPYYAPHWGNVGLALRDLGRREAALNVFAVARLLDPYYAQAWNEWANLLVDGGDAASARPIYEHALVLDATKAVSWHNYGVCLRLTCARDEARAAFAEAIARDPDYVSGARRGATSTGVLRDVRGRPTEGALANARCTAALAPARCPARKSEIRSSIWRARS